jgi:hypothetical protein
VIIHNVIFTKINFRWLKCYKKGNKWVINSSATLSDGRKASAVKTLAAIDEKTITWQASGQPQRGGNTHWRRIQPPDRFSRQSTIGKYFQSNRYSAQCS